jgi:hypothetical protein
LEIKAEIASEELDIDCDDEMGLKVRAEVVSEDSSNE